MCQNKALNKANSPPIQAKPMATTFTQDSIIMNFYIPTYRGIEGKLIYRVSQGDYELKYEWSPPTPIYRPLLSLWEDIGSETVNFKVATENIAKISWFEVRDSGFGFDVGVVNLGSNEFKGQLNFETPFYQTKTTVSLDVGRGATYTINLAQGTQTTLVEGTYTAKAVILYDGNEISKNEIVFGLEPEFEIGVDSSGFKAGENGTISVGLKNVGHVVGEARVRVKLLDLVDEEKTIWLEPQGVGSLSYKLQVPGDFEDGTFSLVASAKWQGASGEILGTESLALVRIKGIRLNAAAGLDRESYTENDMAALTLTITNLSDVRLGTLSLSTKVKFNDYAATQTFTLEPATSTQLTFQIPINHTGQKLTYGIYSGDERAIWLDAIYVREKGTLTLISDRQLYNQGGTVTLTIIMQEPGTVSLTTPGDPAAGTIVFSEAGSKTFTFKLPAQMLTGTYYLYYDTDERLKPELQSPLVPHFSPLTPPASHLSFPIDVRGIGVVVKETMFDREEYSFNQPFNLRLSVEIAEEFTGRIKAWIVDTESGKWTTVYESDKIFGKGKQAVVISGTTTVSDRQRLVYGIYLGTQTLVSSCKKDISIYNISKARDNMVEKDGLSVEIPLAGLTKNGKPTNALFDFYPVVQYSSPSSGIQPITVYEFIIYDQEINIAIPIKVWYNLASLPQGVVRDSVKAYYIEGDNWAEIDLQELKADEGKLIFYLPHFSLVGIGAKAIKPLGGLIVYPNPANSHVTFGDNLPATIKVRIFNVAGEEIYEYKGSTDNGKWNWYLINKADEKVSSGIYIYVISSDTGDKKTGKIGVIK
ncbi:MAG: T9SS type A sorting domain-containing protein [bacterium]